MEIEFEVSSYNKENSSYILFRTLDEYYMGEYELKEASDMIKFSYREFE